MSIRLAIFAWKHLMIWETSYALSLKFHLCMKNGLKSSHILRRWLLCIEFHYYDCSGALQKLRSYLCQMNVGCRKTYAALLLTANAIAFMRIYRERERERCLLISHDKICCYKKNTFVTEKKVKIKEKWIAQTFCMRKNWLISSLTCHKQQ